MLQIHAPLSVYYGGKNGFAVDYSSYSFTMYMYSASKSSGSITDSDLIEASVNQCP